MDDFFIFFMVELDDVSLTTILYVAVSIEQLDLPLH